MTATRRRGSRISEGGGGAKFEIMRAKYWYVIVTSVVAKTFVFVWGGGGRQQKIPITPLLNAGPAERFSAGVKGWSPQNLRGNRHLIIVRWAYLYTLIVALPGHELGWGPWGVAPWSSGVRGHKLRSVELIFIPYLWHWQDIKWCWVQGA